MRGAPGPGLPSTTVPHLWWFPLRSLRRVPARNPPQRGEDGRDEGRRCRLGWRGGVRNLICPHDSSTRDPAPTFLPSFRPPPRTPRTTVTRSSVSGDTADRRVRGATPGTRNPGRPGCGTEGTPRTEFGQPQSRTDSTTRPPVLPDHRASSGTFRVESGRGVPGTGPRDRALGGRPDLLTLDTTH